MTPRTKIISPSGKPMLPARKVAERLDCAQDYVGKLCREGKLKGEQIHNAWFVEEDSIREFEVGRKAAKEARSRELAELRRKESEEFRKTHDVPTPVRHETSAFLGTSFGRATATAFGALLLFVSVLFANQIVGAQGGFFSRGGSEQAAAIAQVESPFFGAHAISVTIPSLPTASLAKNFLSGALAFFFGGKDSGLAVEVPSVPTQPTTPAPVVTEIPKVPSTPTKPSTVVQNTYPVIERTVEKVTTVSGVSEEYLTMRLSELNNSLRSEIFSAIQGVQTPAGPTYSAGGVANSIALSQKIDSLNNVTITNGTIVGGLAGLSASDIPDLDYLPLTGGTLTGPITMSSTTGTSTFANGINLTSGCFAFDGNCISGSGGTIDGSGTANQFAYWVDGNTLGASSTPFFSNLTFGIATGTAATTTNFFASVASSTNLFSAIAALGTATIQALTLDSLNGPLHANNGVVGATTSVGVLYGGTGLTSAPSYGQVLVGNSSGGYTLTATSSLGITGSGSTYTFAYPLLESGNNVTLAFGTTTANSWNAHNIFSSLFATNASTTFATTTNLAVTNVTSSLLKTNSIGQIVAAIAGTDYATFSYPFPNAATSTIVAFTGGILSTASSTIGSGTQAGGLTVSGGATTTGNLLVQGNATTTNLAITNIASGLLTTNANGSVIASSTLSVNYGGTGLSTAPSYGQVLVGNSSGGYTLTSTSSLGITSGTTYTFGYPLVESGNNVTLAFGTTTANSWNAHNIFSSLFATNASTTNATTTNLHITSIASALLKTDANGKVVAAVAGTDYQTFTYPFPNAATTTLLTFSGGILATASSTIGSGTQAGGLTIHGGATTTGNLLVQGSATSTNLAILALANCTEDLETDANGNLVCGTDETGATLAFPFITTSYGVSTSTLVGFTAGILATASSTIGSGTQAGGLTIHGGATTTGNLLVQGSATTTNLALTNLASALLTTNAQGSVVASSTLSVNYGGTGLSTAPSYGQVLVGNSSGGYTLTATTSLGLPTTADLANYLSLALWYATTTDGLDEGLTNFYFTDERSDDRVAALIQAGSGVNLNYNDGANTLTISATGGGGGGSDVNWTYFNGSGLYPSTSTNQVVIGGTATSSLLRPLAKLGVFGGASIDYASTTGITASYASTSNLIASNSFTIANLSGILKATNGLVSAATGGTDYENPLTFAYPLVRSVDAISLAFGTTTANSWNAHNIFSSLFATNASSTNATTTNLAVTNVTSSLLKTNSIGQIVAAIAGTDYQTFSYPFPNAATTTLLTFSGGILATASSTVGSGTQAGGLTIHGGATTTGNLLVQGSATSTNLSVSGTASTSNLVVSGVLSSLLKTSADGTVTAAIANVDYATPGALSGGRDWQLLNGVLVPTTTVGVIVSASSTISGGLTVVGNATSTSAAITGVTSSVLKTNSLGQIVAAVAGTDYQTFTYPFPNAATSTLLTFSGGILVTASSTIGAGGQATGLTIHGGATTTGNLRVSGSATTTALAITSIASSLLKTDSNGNVIPAVAGTDYLTTATFFAYPFPNAATSTLLTFSGGILATASSTIGAGGQATGLTIHGGATTTGNLLVQGSATSTNLSVSGSASTTRLTISNTASSLLKTGADGTVTAAVAGVDYLTSATAVNVFDLVTHFGTTTAATTTPLWLRGGLFASTTSVFTQASTTQLTVGSDFITDFSSGLSISAAGVVTVDNVTAAMLNAEDFGDFSCNGAACDIDANTIGESEIDTTAEYIWTGLHRFTNASSSLLSATIAYFGGTATSSFNSAGILTLAGNFDGPLHANAGVVGATTSIGVKYGGTGLTSVPSYGNILIGDGSGGYTLTSTSSLGLAGAGSQWITTGNDLYYNSGSVGIGTTSPQNKFTVSGGNIIHVASSSPAIASSTRSVDQTYATFVSGKYAYVADLNGGLRILDVTSPKAPLHVGSYTGVTGVVSVIVAGRYAYIGTNSAGLNIIDVSNPSSPTRVGAFPGAGRGFTMALSGKYLYYPDILSGLVKIIDVSNPVSPRIVGTFDTGGEPYGIALQGPYAFVGDQLNSVIDVLDISNPTAPSLVQQFSPQTAPTGMYISGKYLYVADASSGLTIFDVSDPADITSVGTYAGNFYSVQVAGEYAYVGNSSGIVSVLDVHISQSPKLVGSYDAGGNARGLFLSGKYAYIAASAEGLHVLDINGTQTPSATIGSLEADIASINDNLRVGGNIYAQGGLDVGLSGIFSRGTIAAFIASTTETNAAVATFIGGHVGIGTSSPFARLSVHANNGETNATLFAISSSTASATTTLFSVNRSGLATYTTLTGGAATTTSLSVSGSASTTNLTISGVLSSLLKTSADGTVTAAVLGTDYLSSAIRDWSVQGNGYLAPTSTRGVIVAASSTIGDGSQTGGLTIHGGATTTGNLRVSGSATTTALAISSITSALLKTDSNGNVIPAVAGTDYLTTATFFAYPFPNAATSTLLTFSGGILATASSTIGAGGQATGLTIHGGATTTGNLLVQGSASTTNLAITNIASGNLLKTTTGGAIIAAVLGTDYLSSAIRDWSVQGDGYLAPTTTRGVMVLASSTIGNGAQGGGLTIYGSATTTGHAYFGQNVGIGTSTPGYKLQISEDNTSGTQLTITGSTNPNNRVYIGYDTDDNYARIQSITEGSAFRSLVLNPGGTAGNVGIGTTSPYARLSVESLSTSGTVIGADARTNFTGNLLDLKVASTSRFSINQNGSTTLYQIPSQVLTTNSSGVIVGSSTIGVNYGGTGLSTQPSYGNILVGNSSGGYTLTATSSLGLATFAYPFPNAATSTLLTFSGGILSTASSTIGAGGQTTGLTIHGGATTTGNAYFVGSVGINNPAPGYRLDVVGDARITTTLNFGNNATSYITSATNPIIYATAGSGSYPFNESGNLVISPRLSGANRDIIFMTDSAGVVPAVVIQEEGNVGVGTTTPTYRLQVNSDSTNWLKLENSDYDTSAVGTALAINAGASSGNTYARLQVFNSGGNAAGNLVLQNSGGNVGIGTTTPTSLLNVAGATAPKITLSDTNASTDQKHWFIESDTGQFSIGTTSDALSTNTAYRALVVESTGNVGIGTMAASTNLHVKGVDNTTILTVEGGTATVLQAGADASGDGYLYLKNSAGTATVQIDADSESYFNGGNVGVGTTSPFGKLSVMVGGTYASQAASTAFAIGSSTAGTATSTLFSINSAGLATYTTLTGGGATTTNLAITTLANALLATNSSGSVVSTTTLGANFIPDLYIRNDVADSAAGLITFVSGLLSQASSTIGSGTQAGGLTIHGGATTTGNLLVQGNATTTNLALTNLASALLTTNAQGSVIASSTLSVNYGGTGLSTQPSYGNILVGNSTGGYTLTATSSLGLATFAYPFPNAATSTLLTFSGGILSTASSTIGAGGQTTGLTIHGGATTTGNFVVQGTGTSTIAGHLNIAGRLAINGTQGLNDSGSNFDFYSEDTGGSFRWRLGINGAIWMYLNNSSGNLGISSSTPWGKLSVTNTGSGPSFVVEDDTSPDSTPFIVDASGNVGIGTASPTRKLTIYDTAANAPSALFQDDTTGGTNADGLRVGLDTSTNGLIYQYENKDLYFGTNATERLRITSSGNVGIGTTSPYARLSVEHLSTTGTVIGADARSNFTGNLLDLKVASTSRFSINQNGSTTLYQIPSQILTTNSSGVIIGSSTIGVNYGGTGLSTQPSYGNILVGNASGGYTLTATSSLGLATFAYPFPNAATSTLLTFSGGILVTASSTIGDGSATGGLTVHGSATTTGNLRVQGQIHQGNGVADAVGANNFHDDIVIDNTSPRLEFRNGTVDFFVDAVNSGNDLQFLTESGNTPLYLTVGGNVGVGSTSPFAKLSTMVGDTYASQAASTAFAIGSSTAGTATSTLFSINSTGLATYTTLTGGAATTTNLAITNLASALLTTNSSGSVIATSTLSVNYGGTGLSTQPSYGNILVGNSTGGYTLTATSSLGLMSTVSRDWQISNGALVPTTTLGILVSASSTIGNGTQAGGLTIYGGATTTGNMYIAGALGIGTTTPGAKLETYLSSGNTIARFVSANDNDGYVFFGPSNKQWRLTGYGATGDFALLDSAAASRPLYIQTGTADRFLNLNSTGVGIGTTTPTSLLNVAGATAPKITLSDTNASTDQKHWFIESDTGQFSIGTTSDALSTNTTHRALVIDSTGYVGIGTITASNELTIKSAAPSNDVVSVQRSSDTGDLVQISEGAAGDGFIDVFDGSGNIDIRLNAGGSSWFNALNVGIGTTTPWGRFSISGNDITSPLIVADAKTGFTGNLLDLKVASSTRFSINQLGSTTLYQIPSQVLTTNSSGVIIGSSTIGVNYGGTGLSTQPSYGNLLVGNASGGYTLTATSSLGLAAFSYPFPNAATSTLLTFSGGILATASSTIGNGTTAGGLTIDGTSTTTGRGLFGASGTLVGVGQESTGRLALYSGSTQVASFRTGGMAVASTMMLGFTSGAITAAHDTTLSRLAAGIIGFGNGTIGDTTGGIIAGASSTIGSGAQAGGLTIHGGATTTGNAYFAGSIGVGVQSPARRIDISGSGTQDIGVTSTDGIAQLVLNGFTNQNSRIVLQENSSNKWFIGNDGSDSDKLKIATGAFGTGADYLTLTSAGFLGIGSTTPWGKLSVSGSDTTSPLIVGDAKTGFSGNLLDLKVASSTRFSINQLGSTTLYQIPSQVLTTNSSGVIVGTTSVGVAYGGTGATSFGQGWLYSNGGTGVIAASTSPSVAWLAATSTTATSTFAGGLDVGNGALQYDFSSGITSIDNLALGALTFDTDAGIVSWIDMPVTSNASQGTVMSYSAQLDGNPLLTIYSESDGSGGIQNSNIGIGTTSPYAKLSVAGQIVASHFTATSTATSTFTNVVATNATTTYSFSTTASSTNLITTSLTARGATTTNLSVSNAASSTRLIVSGLNAADCDLKADTSGNISCGTDATGSGFAFPFTTTSYGVSTSTIVGFTAGLMAQASSTIGAGGQTTGLTIHGGATTTGNAYFAGNVGIGTSSPFRPLSISSATDANIELYNSANSRGAKVGLLDGFNAGIDSTGGATLVNANGANYLTVGSSGNSYFSTGNVGVASTAPWGLLSVNPNGITGPSFVIGSSTKTDLIVTNAGRVGIGSTTPNSALVVTGGGTTFAPALFVDTDAANGGTIVLGTDGTNGDQVRIGVNGYLRSQNGRFGIDSTGNPITFEVNEAEKARITATGHFGIGSSTPWGKLSVSGSDTTSPLIVADAKTGFSGNIVDVKLASTTVFRVTQAGVASSTGIVVSGLNAADCDVKASTSGVLSCGTDSAGGGSFPFITTSYGVSTSTIVGFTAGLMTQASSTIGAGGQTTGLTISGGATTTGNHYIAGNVGIGTQPDTGYDLDINGFARISNGYLYNSGTGQNQMLLASASNYGTIQNDASNTWSLGYTPNNSATLDTAVLTWNTSGRVGVGSTTPWGQLAVNPNGITGPSFVIGSSTRTQLIVTNSGWLGVGTAAPSAAFHVVGTSTINDPIARFSSAGANDSNSIFIENGSGAAFSFFLSGGTNAFMPGTVSGDGGARVASSRSMHFGDSTGNRLTLKTGGNVGVASSTPYGLLSVNPNGITGPSFVVGSSTRTDFIVTTAGNVGIGTTSPAANLEISATTAEALRIDGVGDINPAIRFADDGVNKWHITHLYTDNLLQFVETGVAVRLSISPGGNVGVGTSTPFGLLSVNPNGITGPAFVVGSSTKTIFKVDNDGTTSVGDSSGSGDATFQFASDTNAWAVGYNSSDKSFNIASSTNFSSNVAFTIKKNGANNVGISSTTPWRTLSVTGTVGFSSSVSTESGSDNVLCIDPTTYEMTLGGASCAASSLRYKDNIENIQYGLDTVRQMRPVSFNWNELSGAASTSTLNVGFIAEEMFALVPEVVELDAEGQVQGLDYDKLTAVLASAIQELDLNLATIASTTASSTPASQNFATSFMSGVFGRIGTWLADAGNGLANIFATTITAEVVHAKKLCLEDVCITKTELQALLNGTSASPAPAPQQNGGSTTPPPSADPEAPMISLNGANPAHISVGSTYADLGAVVTDNVDENLGYTVSVNGGEQMTPEQLSIDTTASTTYTITYSAVDQDGNVGTATRTVFVEGPTVEPVDTGDTGTTTEETPAEETPAPAEETEVVAEEVPAQTASSTPETPVE